MTPVRAAEAATVLRLRPGVHASPVAAGLHVRGWASSFLVEGGPGVWRLWQVLDRALASGCAPDRLPVPAGPPPVRAAMLTLLDQLRAQDMVVEVPAAGWPGGSPPPRLAGWLESVAADPAAAWTRLARSPVTVSGTGAVAAAAVRALRAAGVPVESGAGGGLVGGVVAGGVTVLRAGGHAVAAAAVDPVGFAGPVGPAAAVGPEAARIADRLGLPAVSVPAPPVLAALVGGAAAHRLLCAVAGLPDPAAEEARIPAGMPAVLVARLDPLRAEYRPWLPPGPAGTAPADLDAALARVDALCDPDLGGLPPAEVADLPQVPAGLARCADVVGVGATPDVARLLAVLGAVERVVAPGAVAAGTDRRHAEGVLLRRQAAALTGPSVDWAGGAVARRWWKALTLRFAVPAAVDVQRLADGVHVARVTEGGRLLATAVEATPGDAAAFAALAATGAAQWRNTGLSAADVVAACGATPAPPVLAAEGVPWHTADWAWPAGVADREDVLQERLRLLLGDAARMVAVPAPAFGGVCVLVASR